MSVVRMCFKLSVCVVRGDQRYALEAYDFPSDTVTRCFSGSDVNVFVSVI